MKCFQRLFLVCLLSVIAPAQQPQSAQSANSGQWTYDTADSGRPMLELVRALRDQFGWQLNIEDSPVDGMPLKPNGTHGDKRPMAPRMHFALPMAQIASLASNNHVERHALVRNLLDQHKGQSKAGDQSFTSRLLGSQIEIRPDVPMSPGEFATKNPHFSPLEAVVVIKPAASYSNLNDVIQDIVAQVARTKNVGVVVGNLPLNIVLNNRLRFDVPFGTTAGGALGLVFAEFGGPSHYPFRPYWELIWDAGLNSYVFNIGVVQDRSSALPANTPTAPQTTPTPSIVAK